MKYIVTTFLIYIFHSQISLGNIGADGSNYSSLERLNSSSINIFSNKPTEILDTLPSDMPPITVRINGNHYGGNLLISVMAQNYGNYLLILDSSMTPIKYKKVRACYDFKLHPNGLFSYNDVLRGFGGWAEGIVYLMDNDLNIIDSVQCGNGYYTDIHDFLMLRNGHKVLFAYDMKRIDMSQIVEGGNTNALVAGTVIQELDNENNVVFQWRSWDHIDMEDTYDNLKANTISYLHTNAIEVDYDGNFLLCNRNTCDIIKISRTTGKIIWRLGGKKNEFTFIDENKDNEPLYFSFQHDIRRLPNGNITLYDNGSNRNPRYSRVAEYELDEINKTARLVWEYRHNPDISGQAQGSAQRLPNGNTLVAWGSFLNPKIDVTEIDENKEVVLELSFPIGVTTYRAYKTPVNLCPSVRVTKNEVVEGNEYEFSGNQGNTGVRLNYSVLKSTLYPSATITKYDCPPINPKFEGKTPYVLPYRFVYSGTSILQSEYTVQFDLNLLQMLTHNGKLSIYKRENPDFGIFKKLTTVHNIDTEIAITNASDFGEFIICFDDESLVNKAPILVSPPNSSKVNNIKPIYLLFNPEGYFTEGTVEISLNPDFDGENIVLSGIGQSKFELTDLISDEKYYWRAKSKNEAGESAWSQTWSFTLSSPYIQMITPNGGESWEKDPNKSYFIKWDDNIGDIVKIELYKNDMFYRLLRDSANIPTGVFSWKIPADIEIDSSYKIKISSINNIGVTSESEGYFAIRDNEVSVNLEAFEGSLSIYPNPFKDKLRLSFNNSTSGNCSLILYDTNGKLIETLYSGYLDVGSFYLEQDLQSLSIGNYILSLKLDNEIIIKILTKY